MATSVYAPDELIMIHTVVGLKELGSEFNAMAPFKGCRLCGAIYQSTLDIKQYELWLKNDGFHLGIFANGEAQLDWFEYKRLEYAARERRDMWENIHNRRKHNNDKDQLAVEELHRTGAAFTPEAAHVLSSYGIFPTGNKSAEVVHAMATAPRAPLDDPEG